MARLESSRDYIGGVDHPETGELIQLNESHPADVAETVANSYDFLRVANDESEETETESNPDMEADPTQMDYAELRQLAVDADTDEINGRSKKAEIIEYFTSG